MWAPARRIPSTDTVMAASRSIQPFGSATTRPGSIYFTDQSALFVQHKLKPVHFTRADTMANAVSRKVVTHRAD